MSLPVWLMSLPVMTSFLVDLIITLDFIMWFLPLTHDLPYTRQTNDHKVNSTYLPKLRLLGTPHVWRYYGAIINPMEHHLVNICECVVRFPLATRHLLVYGYSTPRCWAGGQCSDSMGSPNTGVESCAWQKLSVTMVYSHPASVAFVVFIRSCFAGNEGKSSVSWVSVAAR